MKRPDKRTLLSQLFQGHANGLRAMKKKEGLINGIVIVDHIPNQWGNLPVRATYTLRNRTEVIEQLTYTEILAKVDEVLFLLPDNGRC